MTAYELMGRVIGTGLVCATTAFATWITGDILCLIAMIAIWPVWAEWEN